jgi:hypothetical protein
MIKSKLSIFFPLVLLSLIQCGDKREGTNENYLTNQLSKETNIPDLIDNDTVILIDLSSLQLRVTLDKYQLVDTPLISNDSVTFTYGSIEGVKLIELYAGDKLVEFTMHQRYKNGLVISNDDKYFLIDNWKWYISSWHINWLMSSGRNVHNYSVFDGIQFNEYSKEEILNAIPRSTIPSHNQVEIIQILKKSINIDSHVEVVLIQSQFDLSTNNNLTSDRIVLTLNHLID